MSDLYQSLSHSKWDCKYHVVFVPKRGRKLLFGKTRRQWGEIFHAFARQKECRILEGHLMPDHVHMCIAIPPKYPAAHEIVALGTRRLTGARAFAWCLQQAQRGATRQSFGLLLSLVWRKRVCEFRQGTWRVLQADWRAWLVRSTCRDI